jgi:GNAT superfamily N-acetyltransferase
VKPTEGKTMFRNRKIDLTRDRMSVLEFHCQINYECESDFGRSLPYPQYRERWLATSQPEEFLSDLSTSMEDSRTIAEVLEDDSENVAGYAWVTFTDVKEYNLAIAEIREIAIAEEYRKQGLGTSFLRHIEEAARANGAHVLRSGTGWGNTASKRLHEGCGFLPSRVEYEKVL